MVAGSKPGPHTSSPHGWSSSRVPSYYPQYRWDAGNPTRQAALSSHFTDKETKAQRGQGTCLKSHSSMFLPSNPVPSALRCSWGLLGKGPSLTGCQAMASSSFSHCPPAKSSRISEGQGMEFTVPWRLAQTHSEPFRGTKEEAPSLIQSPLLRPAHSCSPSVSHSRLRMAERHL